MSECAIIFYKGVIEMKEKILKIISKEKFPLTFLEYSVYLAIVQMLAALSLLYSCVGNAAVRYFELAEYIMGASLQTLCVGLFMCIAFLRFLPRNK